MINELKIVNSLNESTNTYNYQPKDNIELFKLIKQLIKERGNQADLNDIDTSKITNMSGMFDGSKFNGDISKWDVSNVKDMRRMFYNSSFNGDISKWNVSKVENMSNMFEGSSFNGDISKWNVSKVENMSNMFYNSRFNGDISKWGVSNVKEIEGMFNSLLLKKTCPQFNLGKLSEYSKIYLNGHHIVISDQPKNSTKVKNVVDNYKSDEVSDILSKLDVDYLSGKEFLKTHSEAAIDSTTRCSSIGNYNTVIQGADADKLLDLLRLDTFITASGFAGYSDDGILGIKYKNDNTFELGPKPFTIVCMINKAVISYKKELNKLFRTSVKKYTNSNFIKELKSKKSVPIDDGNLFVYVRLLSAKNFKLSKDMIDQFKEEGILDKTYIAFISSENKGKFNADVLPIYGNPSKYVTKWFRENEDETIKDILNDKDADILDRANEYLENN